MKNLIIVANWKANKTKDEAWDWFENFSKDSHDFSDKEIIICPPYTLLGKADYFISESNLKVKIGAQDVSAFEEGAYTGEISATQIKEFADFVIIGHSERREYLKEDEDIISKKVEMALKAGLTPIFCVSDGNSKIPKNVKIVAYEPVSAIGTGNSDTPQDAQSVARKIKSENIQVEKMLYGGSVTSQNVHEFVEMEDIDGVLVGGASLSPHEFLEIVKNA